LGFHAGWGERSEPQLNQDAGVHSVHPSLPKIIILNTIDDFQKRISRKSSISFQPVRCACELKWDIYFQKSPYQEHHVQHRKGGNWNLSFCNLIKERIIITQFLTAGGKK